MSFKQNDTFNENLAEFEEEPAVGKIETLGDVIRFYGSPEDAQKYFKIVERDSAC